MTLRDISTAVAPTDRPANRDQVNRAAREAERGSVGLPIAVRVIALAAMANIEVAAKMQSDYPARPPL